MESIEELAARFDGRAPDYDESPMHRGLASAVAEFVDLDGVHDVLDVATGTGLVLRALRQDAGLTLYGVDISEGMLAVARRELPDGRVLAAEATDLPFTDAQFDLVTCVTALQLIPDADAALREWKRVLRPAGRIVLGTFAEIGDEHAHLTDEKRATHEAYSTPEAIGRFAASAGLELTRHTTWTLGGGEDVCLITELAGV